MSRSELDGPWSAHQMRSAVRADLAENGRIAIWSFVTAWRMHDGSR